MSCRSFLLVCDWVIFNVSSEWYVHPRDADTMIEEKEKTLKQIQLVGQ
jgi:hypothetical protein